MLSIAAALVAASMVAAPPAGEPARGQVVENVASLADPAQTYSLHLPSSPAAGRKAPALIVLDPRGRATFALEIFREAAEELGWIVLSSNQSRSDVTTDPNVAVLQALMPEAARRYDADPRRLYLAGFSGTAIIASAFALANESVAGVVSVGGRLVAEVPPAGFRFAHYGFAGDVDFNNREMREIEAILARSAKTEHRFHQFAGGHQWIDAALARDALEWLEVVAMKRGQRPRDEALAGRALARDLARAAALESEGRPLDALEHYEAIGRTYEGFSGLEPARSAIARLSAAPEVAREREELVRWDAMERSWTEDVEGRIGSTLATMRANPRLRNTDWLAEQLRIPQLQRQSTRGGIEGRTATRLLEAAFAQTGFYLPRLLFDRKEYALAAATLGVATRIHPDRWPPHYDLACAWARQKDVRRAVASLEKAFENGFDDRSRLEADPDFEPIRDDPRFRRLMRP